MLYRATVSRVTGTDAYVIAAQLAGPDFELGPAPIPVGLAVAAGQLVLVGLVDGSDSDVALVAHLP